VGSQPDNRVEKIHLLTLNHFEKDTTSRSLIYFLHSKENFIKQKKKFGNKIEKKFEGIKLKKKIEGIKLKKKR